MNFHIRCNDDRFRCIKNQRNNAALLCILNRSGYGIVILLTYSRLVTRFHRIRIIQGGAHICIIVLAEIVRLVRGLYRIQGYARRRCIAAVVGVVADCGRHVDDQRDVFFLLRQQYPFNRIILQPI